MAATTVVSRATATPTVRPSAVAPTSAEGLDALRAIAAHLIAHCRHRAGFSERWTRAPGAEWRIVRAPCAVCQELVTALGLDVEADFHALEGPKR